MELTGPHEREMKGNFPPAVALIGMLEPPMILPEVVGGGGGGDNDRKEVSAAAAVLE